MSKMITNRICPFIVLFAWIAHAGAFPRVWMSMRWRDPFEDTVKQCAAQGVDVVEVPTWQTNHCAHVLSLLRKYRVKGFTSSGEDPSEDTRAIVRRGDLHERAVFVGGVYRGCAIDRTLFAFTPEVHDIVIEPPVYSAVQCYTSRQKEPDGSWRTVKSGHYFGSGTGYTPVGHAEVIVPERLFDGKPHLKIIPCELLSVEPGMKPENDTVTTAMSGPEIENRRLVRLRFDLTACADMCLDKVGIAVYWASNPEGASWKRGRGQLSVFSEHTRAAARRTGEWRINQWRLVNGGMFPTNEIIAIRFGDECFNLTGHLNHRACSFPIWGFSESGRRAFAEAAPAGLVQPRTWGYPEIYGAEAYGVALYAYHKACAELVRAFAKGVHSIAPSVMVIRNTTRGGVWDESNDHDGSGQELLARELDLIHLDPYPVGKSYNAQTIPFDMGYMSGLARRYNKPLLPWLQAHSYAPSGLGNITPEDMARMWSQHTAFAPDGIMWLGFDLSPGTSDTEMTFPKGSPESWAYAKELHTKIHTMPPAAKPVAKLAVLRPYSVRALCCAQGAGWESWRNPADRILMEYAKAWSLDHGQPYDIFEIPPRETDEERAAREKELRAYTLLVSTLPYPGARVVGAGTEGKVMTAKEMSSLRTQFVAEIERQKKKGEP